MHFCGTLWRGSSPPDSGDQTQLSRASDSYVILPGVVLGTAHIEDLQWGRTCTSMSVWNSNRLIQGTFRITLCPPSSLLASWHNRLPVKGLEWAISSAKVSIHSCCGKRKAALELNYIAHLERPVPPRLLQAGAVSCRLTLKVNDVCQVLLLSE